MAEAEPPFRTGDGSERLTFATYEDRYDPTLLAMIPGREAPEIREVRRRLLNQRDIASRVVSRSEQVSEDMYELNRLLLLMSGAFCFRKAPLATLTLARRYGLALLRAMRALDELAEAQREPE
jgi:hypothetical protein